MGRKDAIKLGMAVCGLGAAAAVLLASGNVARPTAVSDPRPLHGLCTDCGHHFRIEYQDYRKVIEDRREQSARHEPGGQLPGRRPVVLTCPQCMKPSALIADRCHEHDVYFPKYLADGARGRCPRCKPIE